MSLDKMFAIDGADLIAGPAGRLSRREAFGRARAIATALKQAGLNPGDRVALLCQSPAEAVVGFVATLMTPYAVVPIHPAVPDMVMTGVLAASEPTALISDLDELPDLPEIARVTKVDTRLTPVDDLDPVPERGADDVAALLFTSGTTGAPKGVTVTLGNLLSMADRLTFDFFRVDRSDTILMAAPISNIYGVSMVVTALRACATLSIPAAPRPDKIVETIKRDQATFLAGVPIIGAMLLREVGDQADPLPSLKRVLLAGTKLDLDLANRFAATFGCEVMTGYAMTEAVPLCMLLETDDLRDGYVGAAARDIELRVVDDDLRPVPTGEAGEILVRGPVVTPGYWRNDAANKAAFHEGWLRTGDVGRIDQDGQLQLIDRVTEIIKTAGNTVFPSDVESVLKANPGVADAAVLGQAHEGVGEVVVAYFTRMAESPCDLNELKTWCSERLFYWQVPRKFIEIEAMPMTASGKISRAQLRASQAGSA